MTNPEFPDPENPSGHHSETPNHSHFLIHGITSNGETFRPSDWADRMSDGLSKFKGCRVIYSPLLRPVTYQGHKCVLVGYELETKHPALYDEIRYFAKSNQLKITENIDPLLNDL
jgi:hypothetical protein